MALTPRPRPVKGKLDDTQRTERLSKHLDGAADYDATDPFYAVVTEGIGCSGGNCPDAGPYPPEGHTYPRGRW